MNARTARVLAVLGLLAACAVRAALIGQESLWRDETDSIRFALEPAGLQSWRDAFLRTGFNGPLYLLALRGWLSAAGSSDLALRAFSLLSGIVLIALVGALARTLARNRRA
jgi:hypothetical protein